jgi:hypothetical protein
MLRFRFITAAVAGCLAVLLAASGVYAQEAPKPATPAKKAEQPAPPPQPPQLKQIALTDKLIEQFLAGQTDIDAMADKIPDAPNAKPDPKLIMQLEDTAKKYGFASFAEYNEVVDTIALVLSGFDPQTKSFVGAEAVIKAQIAEIQADKKMAPKDKKAALDDLNDALTTPAPVIEHKGNIDLVAKNYDKLAAAMQEDD